VAPARGLIIPCHDGAWSSIHFIDPTTQLSVTHANFSRQSYQVHVLDAPAFSQDIDITEAEREDLLKLPPRFEFFIPLPTLSVSALLHCTTLPDFDPALGQLNICKFFSSVECNTSDVASSVLQRSIPPLRMSSQLLDTFSWA